MKFLTQHLQSIIIKIIHTLQDHAHSIDHVKKNPRNKWLENEIMQIKKEANNEK